MAIYGLLWLRENAKRLNNWMSPPIFPWSRIPTYEQNLLLSFKVSWMPGLTYPYAVSHWLVVRCSMYLPVFQPISNHAIPFTFTRRFCPSQLWVIWSQNIFHPFLFSTPWNVFAICICFDILSSYMYLFSYLFCSTFPFRILINHQFTHLLSTLHLIYMYLSSYMYLSDILSSYMYLSDIYVFVWHFDENTRAVCNLGPFCRVLFQFTWLHFATTRRWWGSWLTKEDAAQTR